MRFFQSASAIVAVLALASSVSAQAWIQSVELEQPGPDDEDLFGNGVAIDGDVAVVGAPGDSELGDFTGRAIVYRFDGSQWVEEQILQGSGTVAWEAFGVDVAIQGDVILVGASSLSFAPSPQLTGSVYVFRFDGTSWIEEQILLPIDVASGDRFGRSVAIDGDVIVAGSAENVFIGAEGAAYVFRYDGSSWYEEQKLQGPITPLHLFGNAVAVEGDTIVVGAPGTSASVYVYRYDGAVWNEEQELLVTGVSAAARYGARVGLSGDVVAISAGGYDVPATLTSPPLIDVGAAFVFRYDGITWLLEQQLEQDPPLALWEFGFDVDVEEDVLIATSYGGFGNVHVYEHDGSDWVLEESFQAVDATSGAAFGWKAALNGGRVIVGAPLEDIGIGSIDSGSVYIFDGDSIFIRGHCNSDGVLDISDAAFLLGHLFVPGFDDPPCEETCDFNDDGVLDITDAVVGLAALFAGGVLPGPTSSCASDPTLDSLTCDQPPPCP